MRVTSSHKEGQRLRGSEYALKTVVWISISSNSPINVDNFTLIEIQGGKEKKKHKDYSSLPSLPCDLSRQDMRRWDAWCELEMELKLEEDREKLEHSMTMPRRSEFRGQCLS